MFEQDNKSYIPSKSKTIHRLDKGVYNLKYNQSKWRTEAEYISSNYSLPSKIYGVDGVFADMVVSTFQQKQGNLGVLLSGYRGCGKTMLGKIICNKINLPVFMINSQIGRTDFHDFLLAVEQDCIFFIDEYEKIYENKDDLLVVLDGVLSLPYKALFILTCNSLTINENLLNRPNRIYYVKNFLGLEENVCTEIVEDKLLDLSKKDEVIDVIGKFETITADIVINFLDAVNQHPNMTPVEILSVMNINIKRKNSIFGLNK